MVLNKYVKCFTIPVTSWIIENPKQMTIHTINQMFVWNMRIAIITGNMWSSIPIGAIRNMLANLCTLKNQNSLYTCITLLSSNECGGACQVLSFIGKHVTHMKIQDFFFFIPTIEYSKTLHTLPTLTLITSHVWTQYRILLVLWLTLI